MTAALFIYAASVIENIGALLVLIGTLSAVFGLIFTIGTWITDDKYHGKHWVIALPICVFFVASLIPSRTTMYLMAGAVLGEKAVESEVGQQTLDIVKLQLNKMLEELKKEAQK